MNITHQQALVGSHTLSGTLILVAPKVNSGGVGDYAEDFASEVSKTFSEYGEVRTGGPGQVGVIDLIRYRKSLSRLLKESRRKGPVVVHFELSAGSLAPFWLLAGIKASLITATVHDPPFAVWWPFRTRLISRNRWITHGIHYPLRRVSAWIERRVLRNVTIFALSDLGAESLSNGFPACEVLAARHFVPARSALTSPWDRPLALGLFGHAYKGKGFDKLLDLRRAVPSDVGIVVAGRGTDKLPAVEGVTVLGGVDGEDEDRFFGSVRAILLPYANTSRYGEILSVSGVAARSFAYGTPVVAARSGTLFEAALHGGLLTADNSIPSMADLAVSVVKSESRLSALEKEVQELRSARTMAKAAVPFIRRWGKVDSNSST